MLEISELVEQFDPEGGTGFTGKLGTLYFAYGSNMNPEQLRLRGVRPLNAAIAKLPNHDVAFFGHSRTWDGAMETVVSSPGRDVWGVLYQLTFTGSDVLDGWQDVRLDGTGSYFHCPTEVIDTDEKSHIALLYKKDILGVPLKPSREYLDYIVRGGMQHGLPADYIERLRGIESKPAEFAVPVRSKFNLGLLTVADCSKCEGS